MKATLPAPPDWLLWGCRRGLRTETSIVAETAQCFSTHQFCVLIGYGAHAVCPYLALETCRQWRQSNRSVWRLRCQPNNGVSRSTLWLPNAPLATCRTQSLIKSGKMADISAADAQKNFKKAIEKGILKILSKMGISLLSCYHGAQIFEIYGMGKEVVDLAFRGSVSRIGGLNFSEIQRETESFWIKVSRTCCASHSLRQNFTEMCPPVSLSRGASRRFLRKP